MKENKNYKLLIEILSSVGVKVNVEEIAMAFLLNKKEIEELLLYGTENNLLIFSKDGKIGTSSKICQLNGEPRHENVSELYAKLFFVLIKSRKIQWSNLEIDRLSLQLNMQGFDSYEALRIGLLVGEIFEEEYRYESAVEIYLGCSSYCEKNKLPKDIFVECVLKLSKVQFLRGITSFETVKLQEKALELVSSRNSTYNDGILMVYTGINQTNIYRDEDGARLRSEGMKLLEQFEDIDNAGDFIFAKAWSHSWSGEVEKIIALYEDLIVFIEKKQVEKMGPFMYLPIIFGYFYLGEYSKALVISEILYKDAKDRGDMQAAAILLSVLGRCHVYLNNLEKAGEILYESLEESTQIGYYWAKYYTLIALSFLHYKQKNVMGCIDVLEMSDKMSKDNNLGNIQNSPFILDVFKFIDESGQKCSLQSYDSKIDAVLKSTNNLMRGVALRHDAERKSKANCSPEEVILTFNQSISLLTKAGAPVEIGYSQLSLAKCFLKIKNREAATKYAQRAYESLPITERDGFPSDLLGFVHIRNSNVSVKLETLALELKHILDKEKLMARMVASLEKIIQAECGAIVEYSNQADNLSFKENIVSGKEEDYGRILADGSFVRETKKIYSYNVNTDSKLKKEDNSTVNLIQFPSFKVVIPIVYENECNAVIYIESYLRNTGLSEEEFEALKSFSTVIAPHFYALTKYDQNCYLAPKVLTKDAEEKRIKEEFYSSSEKSIQEIESLIERVGMTDVPVLINGETGVGKEYFAKKVFQNSQFKNNFIKVNCGAIPESLLESELFGYEKGSFTGAAHTKIGYFEAANGGTVFLDEIGELPLYAQTKLLRVLQEKTIMRVGSVVETKVNFRLIAATNRDLEKEVEKGTFRQDLFYRINLIQLNIPALRKRKKDIIEFANFFLKKYGKELGMNECRFTEDTIRWMLDYSWPGNVRELENTVHRALLMSTGNQIHIDPIHKKNGVVSNLQKVETLDEVEKKHILKVLEICDGRIGGEHGAAELLGVKRTTLHSKMERLGIKKGFVK